MLPPGQHTHTASTAKRLTAKRLTSEELRPPASTATESRGRGGAAITAESEDTRAKQLEITTNCAQCLQIRDRGREISWQARHTPLNGGGPAVRRESLGTKARLYSASCGKLPAIAMCSIARKSGAAAVVPACSH